ncbi:Tim44-domain-containing protein [Violaceomyces palustris]|uniref:Tim44-domain-containing protein n=1 Tax=Violaceomyces palustris TaxID=1673888 RepID=A0ACD0P8H9_9BASI|nr:Tim44-domain-containing protein [Violaceomyces palustris]
MAKPSPSTIRVATSPLISLSSRRNISSVARSSSQLPRRSQTSPSSSTPSPSSSSSSSAFTASRLHSSRPSQRSFHSSSSRHNAPKSPFQAFVDTLKEELKKSQEMQENMKQLQGEAGKMQDSETMKKMREAYERARIITSIKENPRLQKAAEALRKSGGHVGEAVGATLKQMEDSELIKGLGAVSSRIARQLEESTAPIRNTEAYKAFSQTLIEAFDDGGSALRIQTDADADARTIRKTKREARLRKIGRPPPSEDVDSPEYAEAIMKAHDAEVEAAEAAAAAAAEKASETAEDGERKSSETGKNAESEEQAKKDGAAAEKDTSAKKASSPSKKMAGYAVRSRAVTENPEAGEALVLRPEPAYKQAWSNFKDGNPLFRKMGELKEAYDESENPLVERVRGVTEWIGSLFEENEFAQVTRQMKLMDPSFNVEHFQRDLREYIVPEIIDAYHGAQRHLLRQWCGEATFNLLMATIEPYLSKGYLPEGRLLDVRNIDILQAKMLENNIPVFVVSFKSQELMYFKDAKTGEIKAGNNENADLCMYAMVLTRVEEELDNEITGGWKVVELARRGQAAYL